MTGPSEHAEPGAVAYDQGWADGYLEVPRRSTSAELPHVQRAYEEGYVAGHMAGQQAWSTPWPGSDDVQESVPSDLRAAFCPDCDDVHPPGRCALRVVQRDPWWVRALGWLAGRWPPRDFSAELDNDRRYDR
ncbi:MAG TPA: hypothetical protein VFR35_07395 [Actinoplanes sp.]|nr:hypothetical protein [Actinoplanes sp.]